MRLARKAQKLIKNPRNFIVDFLNKRKPITEYQLEILNKKPEIALIPPIKFASGVAISSESENRINSLHLKALNSLHFFPRVAVSNVGQTVFTRLKECCLQLKIDFMIGGTEDIWMKGLHIQQKDANLFVKMICKWFGIFPYLFVRINKKVYSLNYALKHLNVYNLKSFDILCCEISNTNKNSTTYFTSLIHVMFWEKHDSYSNESIYYIREKNQYVHRLRENYFLKMMNEGSDITTDDHGHLYDFDFPIDAVFTWVDGDDQEWKKTKQIYSGVVVDEQDNAARAHAAERFRNRDELKYALRSIEMFAPFIRHIYLVTCGQKPSWLNDLSSRITVVSHEQIYKDISVLPTFNSSGIETQLHHIEGLSEHFLYFNDDFMLTDFCTPEDFFYPNGVMKFFPSEARAVDADIDDTREEYLIADRNAINLMRRDIKKHGRFIMQHCPYPCRRSFLYELEHKFQADFDRCASNRFRSKEDLRPIAFMQYHFAFANGLALPSNLSHRYLALYKQTISQQFNGVLKTRKYKTICINDVGVPENRINEVNKLTEYFLENYFPISSSFEIKSEPASYPV